MKKVFFTAALAMTTLFASAQFMVITTVQEASDEADGFEMEQVTNNIGLGYMLNDKITVGVQRTGEDDAGETTFDLWARYSFGDNMWATVSSTIGRIKRQPISRCWLFFKCMECIIR